MRALVALLVGAAMLALVVYAALPALKGPDQHAADALEAGLPLVGAWLGDWPSEDNGLIERFDERSGVQVDIVDIFLDWQTPWANVSSTAVLIANHGALPLLTWEPRDFTHGQIIAGTASIALRDGRTVTINEYLEEFADGACDVAKETGQPVLIRTLHEMNGNWYPWGIGYQRSGDRPNTGDSFRQAWIKVHDEFTDRCGDRVKFVYAMNHFSGGGTTFMEGYPGDDYVDFIGIDGYNWGGRAEWGWQTFRTLFRNGYCAATAESSRPIIITETASTEDGGDKAEWIRDSMAALTDERYPRVLGIIYFDETKYEVEIDGDMDWSLDTSPDALDAFTESAQRIQALREDPDAWQRSSGSPNC